MRTRTLGVGLPAGWWIALGLTWNFSTLAHADPALRVKVTQRGDLALVGNTLAHDCGPGVPAPVVGTVPQPAACGQNINDSAPDIYWRSDSPLANQAEAGLIVTPLQARSTAVLELPPGAAVTHAFLYWGALSGGPVNDPTATFDRPGTFFSSVDALECLQSGNFYKCVADVTAQVQTNGPGPYRVSGVNAIALANLNHDSAFSAWWMVVLYELPSAPARTLAVFDGLDVVSDGSPTAATLSGLDPPVGLTARLGLVGFDGDMTTGDSFRVGDTALTNAQNPADNLFNATRSHLGVVVSQVGALPRLTGGPGSHSGVDLDVFDITALVAPGQTSLDMSGVVTGVDSFMLACITASISVVEPDLTTSIKTVTDLDGGAVLPGDTLQYDIVVTNTGGDTATEVVLTDVLPPGLTYAANSLLIAAGPVVGALSDGPGDDAGEYSDLDNTIVVRLGAGADSVAGGSLAPGASTTFVFLATVTAGTLGPVANQGTLGFAGLSGLAPATVLTDDDGALPDDQPTVVLVDACAVDDDCAAPTPACDTTPQFNVCVACLDDSDCAGLTPSCDVAQHTCACVPAGPELCDGDDNDCNGEVDEGFLLGAPCQAGLGECATDGITVCDGNGDVTCDAVPGEPQLELCDGLDNDCDEAVDDDCQACQLDADCGDGQSALVCDPDHACIAGCRGEAGNGCPEGQTCSSVDASIGTCAAPSETTTGDPDTTTRGDVPTEPDTGDTSTGTSTGDLPTTTPDNDSSDTGSTGDPGEQDSGGCSCTTAATPPLALLLALPALVPRRRRRR